MTKRLVIAWLILVAGPFTPIAAQKVRKQTLEFEGKKRTYYLLVPEALTPAQPVPIVMLLHGSGRDGMSLMDKWKDLATKEGFIAVAPDAIRSEGWNAPIDGPDFLHELLSVVKAQYPIDSRRMYLFGHSGGASFALYMALYESEYFAAVAIHAGALHQDDEDIVRIAKRKIPIHIAVGDVDLSFPLPVVRATRDMLVAHGFEVGLTEMKGHNHWYYDLAPKINAEAWEFLKQQKLTEEPRYIQYSFK
jgi:poly(3-hydroxybutyrate) depolymerase